MVTGKVLIGPICGHRLWEWCNSHNVRLGGTGSRSEIGFSLVRCSSHLQQGFDATLSTLVFPLCHGMLQPSATQCHGCHGWISFSQAAPVCSSTSHGDQTSQVAVAVGSSFFQVAITPQWCVSHNVTNLPTKQL
jgi:hypothetical protein